MKNFTVSILSRSHYIQVSNFKWNRGQIYDTLYSSSQDPLYFTNITDFTGKKSIFKSILPHIYLQEKLIISHLQYFIISFKVFIIFYKPFLYFLMCQWQSCNTHLWQLSQWTETFTNLKYKDQKMFHYTQKTQSLYSKRNFQ